MSKTYKDRKPTSDPKTWKIRKAALRQDNVYPEDLFQRLLAEYDEMYEDGDFESKQPDDTEDF